jgi:hypothetical protein
MKFKQICLITGLIFTFLVSATGPSSAGILDNASQIVNLTVSGDGVTVLPLSAVARVTPDGGIAPFDPGSNVVVVINKIMWKFKPVNGQTNPIQLRLTAIPFSGSGVSFYNKKSSVGGDGYAAENDNIAPGIPVAIHDPTAWGFYVVDLVSGQPISGNLGIRMVGFLAPAQ